MTQPTVCAVMLIADRQEMGERAVRSWLSQDYPLSHRELLIYDSGTVPFQFPAALLCRDDNGDFAKRIIVARSSGASIGELRNRANAHAADADIIVHWDSDDWSNPARIREQVSLLQVSGCEAVGYHSMLFYETHARETWMYTNPRPKYCLGTSLCYWRTAWQRRPFVPCSSGEDREWLKGVDMLADRSFGFEMETYRFVFEPRMIATIHDGNTASRIYPEARTPDGSLSWRRVPWWDETVRRILEAA